jgi:uncharacterized protein (DUF1501 family)
MMIAHDVARRVFLRHAVALAACTGAAAPLALNLSLLGSAAAQGAGDYKALVCLFLFGGCDHFNVVLPTDAASWAAYRSTRSQAPDSIALLAPGSAPNPNVAPGSPGRLGGVLPIAPLNPPQGRTFALHPLLGHLRTLFQIERRLAIVPNVGPLVMPTTKAQYAVASHPKPPRLFSHNDQQSAWMALAPEGATHGWGGRMGDLLAAANAQPIFTAISAAGNAVWLAGDSVKQYRVDPNGAFALGVDASGRVYGSSTVGAALQRLAAGARGPHPMETDVAAVARRSIDAEALLRSALLPAADWPFGTAPVGGSYSADDDPRLQYLNPLTGAPAFNALAHQFQIVARLIDAGLRGATGARRQVFFVSLGGWDTHDLQNRNQSDLLARLAHALQYFDDTLGLLGARSLVTTFTASDFGRTFTSNGDGTDHGWGSHHFVLGGAVRGGDLYGRFPVLGTKNPNNNQFDSSPDQLGNGALLPEIAVDQLGATLGRWFGLGDEQLLQVFPNLANFDPVRRNLGFMA